MNQPHVASKFVNVVVRFSRNISFSQSIPCNCFKSSLSTFVGGDVWRRKPGWNPLSQDLGLPLSVNVYLKCCKHSKIDYSKVPEICEDELEERFVKGSGPGGSNVNKRTNCCVLRHKPTGIVVKCHLSRVLSENRKFARKMMIEKLDEHYNGEDSLIAQKERLDMKKSQTREQKSRKAMELKQKYKDLLQNNENDVDKNIATDIINGSSSTKCTS